MNPFENINIKDRFRDNIHSPHYGRYELDFNQVLPFREPLRGLALKIKDPETASILYDLLPDRLHHIIQFKRSEDEQGNPAIVEGYEYFLEFYTIGDRVHIAVENIYFAILEFADVLEDYHFFLYSSGQDDNRWLDEYKNENGKLSFYRNMCDDYIYTGRLDFYIARAIKHPDDYDFVRFVLYQLYDRLHFMTRFYNRDLIETVATIDMVRERDIPDKQKQYHISFYSLDKDCPDWYSINKKY